MMQENVPLRDFFRCFTHAPRFSWIKEKIKGYEKRMRDKLGAERKSIIENLHTPLRRMQNLTDHRLLADLLPHADRHVAHRLPERILVWHFGSQFDPLLFEEIGHEIEWNAAVMNLKIFPIDKLIYLYSSQDTNEEIGANKENSTSDECRKPIYWKYSILMRNNEFFSE